MNTSYNFIDYILIRSTTTKLQRDFPGMRNKFTSYFNKNCSECNHPVFAEIFWNDKQLHGVHNAVGYCNNHGFGLICRKSGMTQ